MSKQINKRKIEHIEIINSDELVERNRRYFDTIHLMHRALPEINRDDIDPSIIFMNKKLSFPLLISSMTGGDHELLKKINRNLAIAAETTGVAMGVGSQRIMFTQPKASHSFAIRKHAPTTLLCANLGAVQLNYGFTLDHCQQAVDVLDADALYLHLNPLQEAVQPEGDTNFFGLSKKISCIGKQLVVPLILKEVGSGISLPDVQTIIDHGIRFIDVAGTGGTSWSRIEHHRSQRLKKDNLGIVFQDWGIPTPVALRQLESFLPRITLIASGGIRNGLDMIKAVILGASLCGMASPFLKPAMDSPLAVIQVIEALKKEFVTAMFLLGTDKVDKLKQNEKLLLNL
jgi:isopentenyl-diphosphate Delta-isomerase